MSESGSPPERYSAPVPRPKEINIPLYLIFTILTCGFFNLYWNYKQMEACNAFIKRQEFDFWMVLLFSIITCGIYFIFYQYKMGSVIVEIQELYGTRVFERLPLISVFATIFGLSIVVDCIHQDELNKLIRSVA